METRTIGQLATTATELKNDDLIPIWQDGQTKKISGTNFFKKRSSGGGLAENQQDNVLNEVKGYVDGKIDDTTISDTKTWSSSKIYSSITEPQPGPIIEKLSTVDTGFSLEQRESSFYGRLLQIDGHLSSNAVTMSFLIFVKSNFDNPTSVYATQIAGLFNISDDIYTKYFDLGVSSNGTLTIKNKTEVIARYRFI